MTLDLVTGPENQKLNWIRETKVEQGSKLDVH